MPDAIADLNARFGLPGVLRFVVGPGGLTAAEVDNGLATATVFLHGGHVARFRPRGGGDVLFVSERARYEPAKSIRGGIPVCWPWFGPHPADRLKPDHGFARVAAWSVRGAASLSDGAVELRLGLTDDAATRAAWPHPFDLELAVRVGDALDVALAVRNPGAEPFTYTGALHSYLAVGEISTVSVAGLDGADYVDKVDGLRRKTQRGPVTIVGETDRVYLSTAGDCVVDDPALGRRITVAKRGSRSTVVWNPWAEKAALIADFVPDEYRRMLCVETANALDDAVTVPPGATHTLTTALSVSPRGA